MYSEIAVAQEQVLVRLLGLAFTGAQQMPAEELTIEQGKSLSLETWWKVEEPVSTNCFVVATLASADERVVASPVALTTKNAHPGEVLRAGLSFRVPATFPPGAAKVTLALSSRDDRRHYLAKLGRYHAVGEVTITPRWFPSLVEAPTDGTALSLSKGIALASGREAALDVEVLQAVSTIRVLSRLRRAERVAQGTHVATLTLLDASGASQEIPMRAGIHTASSEHDQGTAHRSIAVARHLQSQFDLRQADERIFSTRIPLRWSMQPARILLTTMETDATFILDDVVFEYE